MSLDYDHIFGQIDKAKKAKKKRKPNPVHPDTGRRADGSIPWNSKLGIANRNSKVFGTFFTISYFSYKRIQKGYKNSTKRHCPLTDTPSVVYGQKRSQKVSKTDTAIY